MTSLEISVCQDRHLAGQVGGVAGEFDSLPFGRSGPTTFPGARSDVDGPADQHAGQRLFGNFHQDTQPGDQRLQSILSALGARTRNCRGQWRLGPIVPPGPRYDRRREGKRFKFLFSKMTTSTISQTYANRGGFSDWRIMSQLWPIFSWPP